MTTGTSNGTGWRAGKTKRASTECAAQTKGVITPPPNTHTTARKVATHTAAGWSTTVRVATRGHTPPSAGEWNNTQQQSRTLRGCDG